MLTFKFGESFNVGVCRVEGVCLYICGLWCPRMRGGFVDGSHGDGGLIRKIPDRGGVRCCLVGLCGSYW